MSGLQQVGCRLFLTFLMVFTMKVLTKEVTEARMQAATLDYANPTYLDKDSTYVRVSRKSRMKETFLTAFFPIIKDIPLDSNITYHTFKKERNAWRSTLLKGSNLFCAMIESNNKLMRFIFDFSDFPHKCPVKKGNYTIKDMALKEDVLPLAMVPAAHFRIKVTWGTPEVLLHVYFLEVRVDKKGKPGNAVGNAAAFLAVNQSMKADS